MSSIGTAYIEIRGDYSNVGKDAKKQGKGIGKKLAMGIGGAIAAAGIGNEIRRSMGLAKSYAKDIAGLSRVTGMDTRASSRWVAVARSRNIEMTKLTMSFTAFSKKIYAAQQGTESAVKVFDELGISQQELIDMDFDQAMGAVADSFKKLENGPKKTAIAQQLFSRSYSALLPLLNEGKIGMEDALAAADKYGVSMSKGQVKAVLAAVKAQRNLNMATEGFRLAVGTTLVPLLTVVTDKLADFLADMRTGKGFGGGLVRAVQTTFRRIRRIIEAASTAYSGKGANLGGLLPDTRTFGQKVADAIAAGIKAADLPGILSSAFEAIDTSAAADTLLQVLLKAVNLAMDPAFWKDHWQEIALLIPLGKIFKIPGLSKLFDILWPWFKRAFMFLGRAGGRMLAGIAKQMADEFLKVLGKLPVWVGVLLVSVVNRVRSYAGRFFSGGRGLGSRLLDGFESLGRLFVRVGVWLIQKVWDGIKSLGGLLARAGKWAADKARDGLASLWKMFYRAGGFLIDKFVDGIKAAPGKLKNIGKWIGNQVQSGIGKLKATLGVGGTVGAMAFGKDGGGLGAVTSLAAKFGNVVTSGYRPGDDGWHGKNRARDYAGGNMAGFAKAVAGRFGTRLLELIYSPLGWGIKNGKKVSADFFGPAVKADHYDHVHVAMKHGGMRGGRGREGSSPKVVWDEGKKTEWWISQEGDPKKNTAWALEALSAVSGNRLAMFKKGGKKKPTAAQRAAKRAARSVRIFNSKMDREDALDAAYEDPKYNVDLAKRLAKVDKLLKNKRLTRDDRNSLLNLRGQIVEAMRPVDDGTSADGGSSDTGLADAIRDLDKTLQDNKKFAEQVHTAHKSVTDTTLDAMLDRSLGGQLSQLMLTLGPRMAT